MKPATIKMDSKVWKLWRGGTLPKDIVPELNLLSVTVVYNALYRERRRRGVPLRRNLGPQKKDKKG